MKNIAVDLVTANVLAPNIDDAIVSPKTTTTLTFLNYNSGGTTVDNDDDDDDDDERSNIRSEAALDDTNIPAFIHKESSFNSASSMRKSSPLKQASNARSTPELIQRMSTDVLAVASSSPKRRSFSSFGSGLEELFIDDYVHSVVLNDDVINNEFTESDDVMQSTDKTAHTLSRSISNSSTTHSRPSGSLFAQFPHATPILEQPVEDHRVQYSQHTSLTSLGAMSHYSSEESLDDFEFTPPRRLSREVAFSPHRLGSKPRRKGSESSIVSERSRRSQDSVRSSARRKLLSGCLGER